MGSDAKYTMSDDGTFSGDNTFNFSLNDLDLAGVARLPWEGNPT